MIIINGEKGEQGEPGEKGEPGESSYDIATTTQNGLMSKEDKAKLDNTLEFETIEEFEFENEVEVANE